MKSNLAFVEGSLEAVRDTEQGQEMGILKRIGQVLLVIVFGVMISWAGYVKADQLKARVVAQQDAQAKIVEMLPVEVVNPENMEFNELDLRLLYRAVPLEMAGQVNGTNPRVVKPNVRLVFAKDAIPSCETIREGKKAVSIIQLPVWDAKNFALGMSVATANQFFRDEELYGAAERAYNKLGKVDVRELQKR